MSVSISGDGSVTGIDQGLNVVGVVTATTLNVGTGASIGSPATNVLTLGTNGSERVRVSAAGSFGIGTNNPTQLLDVYNGNINLYALTSGQSIRVRTSNGTIGELSQISGDGTLRLYTNETTPILRTQISSYGNTYINPNGGSVGIGTTNPTTEFEVLGGGTVASFRGTGGSSFIAIKDEDDGTLGFIGVDGGNIKLQTSGSSYADKLVIDTAGRVTVPYQPAFQTVGTNYSQSGAAYSIIIPNVVYHNQGSHYNGSTGRFTAPVAGRYLFGFWGLSYPHNTEVNQIRGFVNGSATGQEVQFGGAAHLHILATGSILLNLNANDIFDFRYYQASGSAKAYSSQWNMWGYLIG